MAKGKMLTASERANVVKLLMMKKSTLEISKIIKQDHRTVKRFTNEGKVDRKQHKHKTKSDNNQRFEKNQESFVSELTLHNQRHF